MSSFQHVFQAWRSNDCSYRDDVSFQKLLETLLQIGGKAAIETVNFQGKRLLTSAIEVKDEFLTKCLLSVPCDVDKRDSDEHRLNAIEQAWLVTVVAPKNFSSTC